MEPGLVEVVYEGPEDLLVDKQRPVVAMLEAECRLRRTGIYFVVKNVGKVDFAVPQYWLDVTRRLVPSLVALAVSSPSLAVRTAAGTFRVANLLSRVPLQVSSFTNADDAERWTRAAIAAPPA